MTTPSYLSSQNEHYENLDPPENLWTPRMAAARAGYQSPVTVLRAWRAGKLRGYKLNARTVRFARQDVENWLASARV
jgi:hypothetical protein